jgi:hypothetical protein
MEKKGVLVIHGDEAFKKAVRRDLKRMARTQCGRKLMKDIERTGHHVDIHPPSDHPAFVKDPWDGPYAIPHNWSASGVQTVFDPNGPLQGIRVDRKRQRHYIPGDNYRVIGNGPGSSSAIVYDPNRTTKLHYTSAGTTSDVILAHEMNHSRNNALGRRSNHLAEPDGNWQRQWQDLEEHDTVGFENQYRKERGGLYTPKRGDYSVLPAWGLW